MKNIFKEGSSSLNFLLSIVLVGPKRKEKKRKEMEGMRCVCHDFLGMSHNFCLSSLFLSLFTKFSKVLGLKCHSLFNFILYIILRLRHVKGVWLAWLGVGLGLGLGLGPQCIDFFLLFPSSSFLPTKLTRNFITF